MTARELYENETGDKCPNHQIAQHEWHIRYVRWLEQTVVKNISSKPMLADSLPKNKIECNCKSLNEYINCNKKCNRNWANFG
jgi:hypothetical protein